MGKKILVLFVLVFTVSLGIGTPYLSAAGPKNGPVRTYDAEGKLRQEVRYKNGQIILRRGYNDQGKLIFDYRYKNGQVYYKRTSYPDGKIRTLWTQKSGVVTSYDHDGKVRAVVKLSEKDVLPG